MYYTFLLTDLCYYQHPTQHIITITYQQNFVNMSQLFVPESVKAQVLKSASAEISDI